MSKISMNIKQIADFPKFPSMTEKKKEVYFPYKNRNKRRKDKSISLKKEKKFKSQKIIKKRKKKEELNIPDKLDDYLSIDSSSSEEKEKEKKAK